MPATTAGHSLVVRQVGLACFTPGDSLQPLPDSGCWGHREPPAQRAGPPATCHGRVLWAAGPGSPKKGGGGAPDTVGGRALGLHRQEAGGQCVEPCLQEWVRTDSILSGVALLGPGVITASSCEGLMIHDRRADRQGVRGMARPAGRGPAIAFMVD